MLREPISMPASLIGTPVIPGIQEGVDCNYAEVLTCYSCKVKLVIPVILAFPIVIDDLYCSRGQTARQISARNVTFAVT